MKARHHVRNSSPTPVFTANVVFGNKVFFLTLGGSKDNSNRLYFESFLDNTKAQREIIPSVENFLKSL